MKRHILLAVNPRAGSWQAKRIAALTAAFEAAGAAVTVKADLRAGSDIPEDVDHVCVVGGDGTVRRIVAIVRLVPRPLVMSVYPLGTINLLARECGYPSDCAAFVARVMAGPPRRQHHYALIGDTVMLACASVGPDSRSIEMLSARLKRVIGRGAYAVAFARLLLTWPRPRLHVVADGKAIACEAVYVAKGRYYAGPWSFAPAAALDDPLLHVVALPRATRTAFVRFLLACMRERAPHGAIRFTCASLAITADGPVAVQADGDIVCDLPVEIRIAPETIAFA